MDSRSLQYIQQVCFIHHPPSGQVKVPPLSKSFRRTAQSSPSSFALGLDTKTEREPLLSPGAPG